MKQRDGRASIAMHEHGFSFIELLVVILIIAILAAIAIPVFLRQREQGWIAQSQTALKNAASAIESYGTETGGDYSKLDGADSAADNAAYALLKAQGYKKGADVEILVESPGAGSTYCITATHLLMPGGSEWSVSTYSSADGAPSPSDACP